MGNRKIRRNRKRKTAKEQRQKRLWEKSKARKHKKVIENPEAEFSDPDGQGFVNVYVCESDHAVITADLHKGTTPFMIACPRCSLMARSQFYRVNIEDRPITHEWFSPVNPSQVDKEHVEMGGLILRATIRMTKGQYAEKLRRLREACKTQCRACGKHRYHVEDGECVDCRH